MDKFYAVYDMSFFRPELVHFFRTKRDCELYISGIEEYTNQPQPHLEIREFEFSDIFGAVEQDWQDYV